MTSQTAKTTLQADKLKTELANQLYEAVAELVLLGKKLDICVAVA